MLSSSVFGKLADGTQIDLYKITNSNGASLTLQTLGAGIQSIEMPDRDGKMSDVVLGFDNPQDYTNPDLGYQGLVVGRWANRIRDAKYTLNGVEYNTPVNQGKWTLHGGGRFSFTPWQVEDTTDNSVTFKRFSPDGEDGFNGNFTMRVKYTLTEDNIVRVEYTILCDEDTVANPTNHSYFNLSNDKKATVENHILMIDADRITLCDDDQLPTGELAEVEGTPMDFRTAHRLGDKIDEPYSQLIDGIGYDNNYCLNKNSFDFDLASVLYDEESGRKLEVYTDLPGIQLYCGGWLSKDNENGKGDSKVTYRRGVALETQFYPNTLNIPHFPAKFVKANEEFKTVTEFRFSAE